MCCSDRSRSGEGSERGWEWTGLGRRGSQAEMVLVFPLKERGRHWVFEERAHRIWLQFGDTAVGCVRAAQGQVGQEVSGRLA